MKNVLWAACVGIGCLVVCSAHGQGAYLDESLTAQEEIEVARLLIEEGRIDDAVATLDRVVAEHANKVLKTADGVYVDTQLRVRQMVASDARLLEAYQTQNEASAQRALLLALEGGAQPADLERVVYRYQLTRAGLEAGLVLAGRYMERAEANAAASVLGEFAEHPQIETQKKRWLELSALGAALRGDRAALDVAVAELGKLDEAAARRAMAHGAALLARRAAPARTDEPLPRRDAALWTASLVDALEVDAEAEARMTHQERLELDRLRKAQESVRRRAPLPVAAGALVVVNTGRSVRAFDRDSGRAVWSHAPAGEAPLTSLAQLQRQRLMLAYGQGGEARGVAVVGRRVFAVTGQSNVMMVRFGAQQERPDSQLVAMGLGDGRVHWSLTPADVDATQLEDAVFMGTPAVEGSQLFVLARRSKGTSHDFFLVCLDSDTGAMNWLRHTSGASTQRHGLMPKPPAMLVSGGRAYVADNERTAVCVDTRTGSVRWARLMEGDVSDDGGARPAVHRLGEVSSIAPVPEPVLTAGGLLVPFELKNVRAALLDPHTGRVVKRLVRDLDVRTHWLAIDGGLVAVGSSLVRYDGPGMKVRWTVALGDDDVRPIGRAVIVGGQLLVPAAGGTVCYDLANGKKTRRIAPLSDGNLAWADGVLLCARAEQLVALDDWPRAEARLTARAEAAPTDPDPGLALAHLALRLNEPDAVLRGVDLAMLALDERMLAGDLPLGDPLHTRVFGQLLQFTDGTVSTDASLREQLFDRVASMTSGPADEVAYHLARGAYLSEPAVARYADAVEHYQSVLGAPDLAEQAVAYRGYERHAGLEARRRLEGLVNTQGRAAYARYDALAATQLRDLLASGATADRLIALANRYPLAAAAPQAHLEAGLRLIAEGSTGAAVGQLRLAFAHATDDTLRARAAGELAAYYQHAGQPGKAVRWLERVSVERPGLSVWRQGQLADPGSWIADLRDLPDARANLPRLGAALGAPVALPGRLVRIQRQSAQEPEAQGILTLEGRTLRMYADAGQPPRWQTTVADPEMIALAVTDEQVLLWSADRGELLALDGRTGKPQWPARRAGALLQEVTDEDRLPEDQDRADPALLDLIRQDNDRNRNRLLIHANAAAQGQPTAGRTAMVRVSPSVICLADQSGEVVGIDRHTGSVLWRLRSPVDLLDRLTVGPDAVAIVGRTRGPDTAHAGRLVIVDLITGRARLPIQHIGNDLPQWSAFAGSGKFIVLTARHLAAYDLHGGNIAWRRDRNALRLAGAGWSNDGLLVMPDLAGIAQFIDPDTGKTLQSVSTRSQTRAEPIAAALYDHTAYLLSPASMVAASTDNANLWQDAIETDARAFVAQFISQDHAVILALHDGGPGPDTEANPRYALFVLERASGRVVNQYRLPRAITRVDLTASRATDGHLLLATPDRTLAFPATQ